MLAQQIRMHARARKAGRSGARRRESGTGAVRVTRVDSVGKGVRGVGRVGGEVHTCPDMPVLAVFDAQAVEHVCGVQAGVVAELAGDDFEGFGEGFDDGLLFVGDVAVGELVEVGGHFHFAGAAAGDDGFVLDAAPDYHYGVVQGALDFGDELLGAAAEDQGAGFGGGAGGKEVVALGADLDFFEKPAGAEVGGLDVGTGGLNGGAGGRADAIEVGRGDAARAEDVAVGKVLGCEVADGEFGEDDLGAGGGEGFHFVEDDLPFCVDDGLVFGDLLDADFGVVFFRL